jgi:hypothetical protein
LPVFQSLASYSGIPVRIPVFDGEIRFQRVSKAKNMKIEGKTHFTVDLMPVAGILSVA